MVQRRPSHDTTTVFFYFHQSREKNMRADMLTSILKELNGTSADIEASAVISTDGLTMATLLPADMDQDRVGAMSAAMLSLGDRTSKELARGILEQVLVKGDNGYVLMTYAGKEAVLTVIAKPNAKLGLIFLDVKRAAESIAKLI
jgi:predicted regulator of Ras-like GTPase activity (Roadblock/LC7/MglB family)